MAVSTIVAKIAAAYFLIPYYQSNVWMGITKDVSGEIPGYGDALEIPTDISLRSGGVGTEYANSYPNDVSGTYTEDANLTQAAFTAPKLVDAAKVTLNIDQARDLNILLTGIQARRVRPSFAESIMRHNARRIMEEVNDDLRGAIDASAPTRNTSLNITVPNANFGDITGTGNANHGANILKALADAQEAADYRHWPEGMRIAVVSPAYRRVIVEALEEKNIHLISDYNDRLVQMGVVAQYRGWNIVVDDSLPASKAAGATGHTMYFFAQPGVGLCYAGELREMRVVQSEVYRGQLFQGVYTWGKVVAESEKIMRAVTTIT